MNRIERNRLLNAISEAAAEVVKIIGTGFELPVYEECLVYELKLRGISSRLNLVLPFSYKGLKPENLITVPMLVENDIPVILVTGKEKIQTSVLRMNSLLRLANRQAGLIIDFYSESPATGHQRVLLKQVSNK